jgi:hypothetical protein
MSAPSVLPPTRRKLSPKGTTVASQIGCGSRLAAIEEILYYRVHVAVVPNKGFVKKKICNKRFKKREL